MNFNSICKQVISAILAKKLAQNIVELAAQIDEYPHVLYKIMRGEKEFSKRHIQNLVDFHGVDARFFFNQSSRVFKNEK